jgi:hypothetical protein
VEARARARARGPLYARRHRARHLRVPRLAYIVGFLTIVGTILSLSVVGLYYGLHEWTAALTGGVVDARFIVLVDTALESPLGQIAMVPMLAWIAISTPDGLKATYFTVMASFTNLALSAAQPGTKYLNQLYVVEREMKDAATGAVKVVADYGQLGDLLITTTVLDLVVPLLAILAVRTTRLRAEEGPGQTGCCGRLGSGQSTWKNFPRGVSTRS